MVFFSVARRNVNNSDIISLTIVYCVKNPQKPSFLSKCQCPKSHGRIHFLKMLGLYLDTLIIGHKCNNMVSRLNELTLQKELQNFLTKNVFLTKK